MKGFKVRLLLDTTLVERVFFFGGGVGGYMDIWWYLSPGKSFFWTSGWVCWSLLIPLFLVYSPALPILTKVSPFFEIIFQIFILRTACSSIVCVLLFEKLGSMWPLDFSRCLAVEMDKFGTVVQNDQIVRGSLSLKSKSNIYLQLRILLTF